MHILCDQRAHRGFITVSISGMLLVAVGKSQRLVPMPRVPFSVALIPGSVLSQSIAKYLGSNSAHLRKLMMLAMKIGSTRAQIEKEKRSAAITRSAVTTVSVNGTGSQPAMRTGWVSPWLMRGMSDPHVSAIFKGYAL